MSFTLESRGPLMPHSNLSTNVLSWKDTDVILFIETNVSLFHKLYPVDGPSIGKAIHANRINGRGLLKLTVEQMVEKLGLKLGIALSLEDMVTDVKKVLSQTPSHGGEPLPQYREGND